MQLSKLESEAFERLKRMPIFRTKDLMMLLDIDRIKAYNLLKALKRKKAIETVVAGLYALRGTDEFAIGSYLNWPSYLSFWSALSYYGMSDQMPRTIFYATTRYRKEIKNYRYVTISKKRFFGYTRVGNIVIAEKEKAIIDSLLFPKYAGGIREIRRCIENAELDKKKLVNYAMRVGSKAVLRRLSYLLESIGKPVSIRNIGTGFELLDPSLRKGNNLNKKWLLYINDDISG